jgi:hypothetical protein
MGSNYKTLSLMSLSALLLLSAFLLVNMSSISVDEVDGDGPNVVRLSYSTVVTSLYSFTTNQHNLPPLLSRWEAPAICHDRWMISRPGPTPQEGQSGTNIWVFSTWPTATTDPSDTMYFLCQPYNRMGFSPGVCPEGQTIAEVTLFLHDKTTRGEGDFYEGSCCPTYVHFSHPIVM